VNNLSISRFAVAIGALSLSAYACSGDTGEGASGGLANGGKATGSGGTIPGIGGSTGKGGTTGTGGTINPGSGGTGGTQVVDPDTACGTGNANANLLPVNMMVMFDRSGSMLDCIDGEDRPQGEICPSGPSRWDTASAALKAFFADPGAADLGVALRFFPHDSPAPGCSGGMQAVCDEQACSQVLVDMGTLQAAAGDPHETALVSAVDGAGPPVTGGGNQGTPIYAALSGALIWATAYQDAHPEQRTIVVFVTDGEPNGCNEDFDDISALASDALADSGVRTYMIGLTDVNGGGVNQQDMDQVADAGGTNNAIFISDGASATQELIDAFNSIRGMALACDFEVPDSTISGMAIDPHLINVNYTPGAGAVVPLGIVGSADDCGQLQAWYYDNPITPTRIILCPAACDTVSADPNAVIDIVAGCAPRDPDPVQ